MSEIIGISTGCLWHWMEKIGRDAVLENLSTLDIVAIELTFESKEDVFSFRIKNHNVEWIRTLDYVSIHSPPGLMTKMHEDERFKVLKKIKDIYDLLRAKSVTIHVDEMPPKKELYQYGFEVAVENLEKKKEIDFEMFSEKIQEYPETSICLDVSHSHTWSSREAKRFIEKFGDRISQVHFSSASRGKTHLSMGDSPQAFLNSLKALKRIDVPILIEEDVEFDTIEEVAMEIIDVKKVLRDL